MIVRPMGATPPRLLLVVLLVLVIAAGMVILLKVRMRQFGHPVDAALPKVEKVVMQMESNGKLGLCTIDPDGSHFAPFWSGEADTAIISPAGDAIAAIDRRTLSVFSVDGRERKELAQGEISSPVFSPDGQRLAFSISRDDHDALTVAARSGEQHTLPITSFDGAYPPAFSPNGAQLAVTVTKGERQSIWIVNSDGTGAHCVVNNGAQAVFSPDGQSLAYLGVPGDNLYRCDLDGHGQRRLTSRGGITGLPVYSPDGRTLAFCRERGETYILDVVTTDGTHRQTLYKSDSAIADIAFSPDGQRLAFSTGKGVSTVPVGGGAATVMTGHAGGKLSWGLVRQPSTSVGAGKNSWAVGLPAGYQAHAHVRADFDGDQQPEDAYVAALPFPPYSDLLHEKGKPILVLVSKDGKVIWRYAEEYMDSVNRLAARDLTGDGIPELLYSTLSMGASDGTMAVSALRWSGGKFSSVIGTKDHVLSHLLEGGLVIKTAAAGQPATLILYDFIWGDDESHADPHRYRAEWYRWNGTSFQRTQSRETRRKYYADFPLSEWGIHEPKEDLLF
ncbi:MAG TPA: hypothetical protein VGM23_12510 [Armatimonadota bacterium]